MLKVFYQNLIRICFYIGSFLAFSLAAAKVLPSAAYREEMRQRQEFNSYEWFCSLTQNDYDYVHILNDLKLATSAYNIAYLTPTIGAYFFAGVAFFIIILAFTITEKPLRLSTWMIILAFLCVPPTYVLINIDSHVQTQANRVIELSAQLKELEPVPVDTLKYCKPNKPNVFIELNEEVKPG